MSSSEVWNRSIAIRYDRDHASMFQPGILEPAVDVLARLAGDGPALEFAIGTGRVALPLLGRGVPVTGIELSQPMVERLRAKVDESQLPVAIGDMATTTVPGAFSLVYLVFNSISNLRTQAEQVACFRNAARHLRPGGRFVIGSGSHRYAGCHPGSTRHRCRSATIISSSTPTTSSPSSAPRTTTAIAATAQSSTDRATSATPGPRNAT